MAQTGLAIGRHGSILNDIKKRIGWAPKVARTPPIPSKTVGEIRGYLKMVSEDRKNWLKKIFLDLRKLCLLRRPLMLKSLTL